MGEPGGKNFNLSTTDGTTGNFRYPSNTLTEAIPEHLLECQKNVPQK